MFATADDVAPSLGACLDDIVTETLRERFDDGPGWQIEADGRPLAWRLIDLPRHHDAGLTYRVADFYPLTPQPRRPEDAEVVQFVSRDGTDAVIFGFSGIVPWRDVVVHPRGLQEEAMYLVSDPLTADESRRSGRELIDSGLTLPLDAPAALRRLRRVDPPTTPNPTNQHS